MSAQDREALAQARAKATETNARDSGTGGKSIAEQAVHPPYHQMEIDDLERELGGGI